MYKILKMKLRAEAFKEIVGFLEPESVKQEKILHRLENDAKVMKSAVNSAKTYKELYNWVARFSQELGW